MKTEKYDGSRERRICLGMITRKDVLARLAPHWEGRGMMPSRWANLIGGWCVEYLKAYNDAPRHAIEGLFASWASTQEAQGDAETVSLMERYLSSLAGEYDERAAEVSPDHLIDEAVALFDRVSMRQLLLRVQGAMDAGDLERASDLVRRYRRVAAGAQGHVDLTTDRGALRQGLEQLEEADMVVYPGGMGSLLRGQMGRDNFISFLAPEKRGKTFFLIDVAWRALMQRRRTVFFAIGDMSERQTLRRLYSRAARRPVKAGTCKYPVKLAWGGEDKRTPVVVHEERVYKEPLDEREAWEALQRLRDTRLRSDEEYFRLVTRPAGSTSVSDIRNRLEAWALEGWAADVVVIDYADLLKLSTTYGERRDAINEAWTELRGLSQERHCLLVTATQAKAASYSKRTLGMEDFSEDKRKLAHVTGMLTLNQQAEEKKQGLMRVGWAVLREDEFHNDRWAVAAQCLAIADPVVRSIS